MEEVKGLHAILQQLYNSMLTQSGQLIGVGQGLAGFGALFYIGIRVGRSIAKAQPVDVFPLLSPFAKGLAIILYPSLIALFNGLLSPINDGTAAMQTNATASIETLLKQKEEALKGTIQYQMYIGPTGNGDESLWERYSGDATGSGVFSGISNAFQFSIAKAYYNFKNAIKGWLAEILELLYQAASLCVDSVRTFNLIVLAILGPIVLGLSVFDGFHHTLHHWLTRYITVYIWSAVANIFGAIIATIQTQMIKLDLNQIQSAGAAYFSPTDAGYLIFLLIGIIGYFSVPSVSSHIIHVGGGDAFAARVGSTFKRFIPF
ncbi:MAG: conjugative transposon protein TraJ [Bacteroidetes bacterium]|nr:conjugative transposon protein TraJ [Bacteroidota bacterium]